LNLGIVGSSRQEISPLSASATVKVGLYLLQEFERTHRKIEWKGKGERLLECDLACRGSSRRILEDPFQCDALDEFYRKKKS
jgi:hypothetical protein